MDLLRDMMQRAHDVARLLSPKLPRGKIWITKYPNLALYIVD